jgi:threonine aldolase
MRQVGVLAAAGAYALEHHLDRLADDHERAAAIAKACAAARPGVVDPDEVDTNIVVLDLAGTGLDASELVRACAADGVRMSAFGPRRVRLVTHLDIDDDDAAVAAAVLARHLAG